MKRGVVLALGCICVRLFLRYDAWQWLVWVNHRSNVEWQVDFDWLLDKNAVQPRPAGKCTLLEPRNKGGNINVYAQL